MHKSPNVLHIAIVGLPTLESFALRTILTNESDNFKVEEYASLNKVPTGVDFHIVSSMEFISNLQYFLPRKRHLAIIVDNPLKGKEINSEEELLTISVNDSLENISSKLPKAILSSTTDNTFTGGELTQREKDVLQLLASGKTIKEIAVSLCISINTVLTHRKNISTKLGIKSVSGLSLYAMINGYI